MELTLYAVGRLRPMFRSAADEYLERLWHYCKMDEVEVREAGKAPSADAMRQQESERLSQRIREGTRIVVLDREAGAWSSEQLARRVDAWRHGGKPVGLLIGGSHGLSPDLVARSDERWGLGSLTLPHELARVVVLEQCYRAWTILRGEKYHK